jgi:pilus assembly protein CpaB
MVRLSSRSSRFYLFVSIAAAALAAVCLLVYLQGLRSRIAESGRLVQLVVSARDMEAGEVLDPSSLSLVDFPDIYMLPGTYTEVLAVTGATLRSAVRAGEPLLESALLPAGGGGLTLQSLDRGFRAYPLLSSAVSFPASELQAGSRVDILAISGDVAVPLLENIEVLYIYGSIRFANVGEAAAISDDYAGECILLQLTSEEACRLAAAQEGGKVELLLRAGEG